MRRDEGDVGHRRGAATKQMPARRAPAGCGLQQNVKLFLREPLGSKNVRFLVPSM